LDADPPAQGVKIARRITAQAVEHYEMTRYGSLIAWAKQLGRNDCAELLRKNLEEEKAADKTQYGRVPLKLPTWLDSFEVKKTNVLASRLT
jgi:hypothetical protein